jgi:hypothetical protein
LRWLGRFEARFEPLPGGRWDGEVLFLSAAAASEDILDPERFCDPTARLRAQWHRAEPTEDAVEAAQRKGVPGK